MKACRLVFIGILLLACLACCSLVCDAAVPVRLQVTLSSTSVRVNAGFAARIVLVDAHALAAPAPGACPISLDVLDEQTQKAIQPTMDAVIRDGQSRAAVNLVIRRMGFFAVRASTKCMQGIQNGRIIVRVSGASSTRSLRRPYFLLAADVVPSQGTIDVFYPQDGNRLVADGQVAASIQVFVTPVRGFQMFFDTTASISPNPLVFGSGNGDATASLTSSQPGDFTAVLSPSSVPQGYVVRTHPATPPAHHFVPDIRFLRIGASSQKGVPVNSQVTVTVELLDGQHKAVNTEDPVPIALHVNPGSGMLKVNPLIVTAGQSSNFTSLTTPIAGTYSVDADWGDVKSEAPLDIDVTAPIGFFATLLGGLAGAGLSCLLRKKFEWARLLQGALAATGVWLVSGVGMLQGVTASLVSNSFSAAVLGALAGLVGAEVLSILVKSLFGVEAPAAEPNPAAQSTGPEK